MMSPALQPMTYEDLSQVHREEMKGKSLSACRPDLYRAIADLMVRLRQDYEREIAKDPDSIMSEGANQRRKNAETLVKAIMAVRAKKICTRAVNSADGANEELSALTPEEREYYAQIVELSRRQLSLVDRYRGKKTVTSHIDEPSELPESKVPEHEARIVQEDTYKIPETPAATEVPMTVDAMEDAFDEPFLEESFDDIPEPEPFSPQAVAPEAEKIEEPVTEKVETMVLRVLEDLPPFVGPDRDYELHKEDIVTLPTSMALALINSQKAVAINPGP